MKTVAIVCDGIWEQLQGGAEYQLHLLAHALSEHGYRVHYLFTDRGNAVDLGEVTPEPLSMPEWLKWLAYPYHILFQGQIFKSLDRIKPDVIINRVGSAFTGICAEYGAKNNIPTIWHVADLTDVEPQTQKFNRTYLFAKLNRWKFEQGIHKSSHIVIQAKYQDELLKQNYGRSASRLIPNFHPAPNPVDLATKERLVVWIANVKPKKRPEEFIAIARRAKSAGLDAKFVMIGRPDGDYEPFLKEECSSLDNLEFWGEKSIEDVNATLERASIFVNTSIVEGFPNSFIQAWLRGVPVISLSFDPDDVLKKNPVGFCSGSSDQLYLDVEKMLEDSEARLEVAKSAQEYAIANHSLANNTRCYIDLIESATSC